MSHPKHIINNPDDAVEEFIHGLLLQYPHRLQKLNNHNVLLAADRDSNIVQLISGGGSGHEPSHAGWLGSGMLSAAVCGGIFASPSVNSILAAIRVVANAGVLLVVKNYTGDRLNFGLAAEKAQQMGIDCSIVVVADDCALERTKGITGARGVAGTVLVHKIAGAAAASKKSLQDVVNIAKRTCSRMGTLGIALSAVTMPGAETMNNRLDADTIEIGLGIHGEAGLRQSKLVKADEMASEMVQTIQKYGRIDNSTKKNNNTVVPLFKKNDELVILVNNLGGTSNFEMSILAQSCVKLLEGNKYGAKVTRVLVGSFMTSFNMHGASLTILNVQDQPDLVEYLDAQTTAPAWQKVDAWKGNTQLSRPSLHYVSEVKDESDDSLVDTSSLPTCQIANYTNETVTKLIKAAATKLAESEPLLTKYDTIVGDGDCGITMKRGATCILERLENNKIPVDHPVKTFAALADAISASMGGTSGVLLEMLFRKMSSSLNNNGLNDIIDEMALSHAFQAGVQAVALYGGAQVGSRTMLDALVPAAAALIISDDLADAAQQARRGADSTAKMSSASAGRSNYLSAEALKNTPDPGAEAVAIVMEAIAGLNV